MHSAIFDDTKVAVREPIVQCVQIKPLPPQQNHQERYRAVFSDITNYVQTMLATREWPTSQHTMCSTKSITEIHKICQEKPSSRIEYY